MMATEDRLAVHLEIQFAFMGQHVTQIIKMNFQKYDNNEMNYLESIADIMNYE